MILLEPENPSGSGELSKKPPCTDLISPPELPTMRWAQKALLTVLMFVVLLKSGCSSGAYSELAKKTGDKTSSKTENPPETGDSKKLQEDGYSDVSDVHGIPGGWKLADEEGLKAVGAECNTGKYTDKDGKTWEVKVIERPIQSPNGKSTKALIEPLVEMVKGALKFFEEGLNTFPSLKEMRLHEGSLVIEVEWPSGPSVLDDKKLQDMALERMVEELVKDANLPSIVLPVGGSKTPYIDYFAGLQPTTPETKKPVGEQARGSDTPSEQELEVGPTVPSKQAPSQKSGVLNPNEKKPINPSGKPPNPAEKKASGSPPNTEVPTAKTPNGIPKGPEPNKGVPPETQEPVRPEKGGTGPPTGHKAPQQPSMTQAPTEDLKQPPGIGPPPLNHGGSKPSRDERGPPPETGAPKHPPNTGQKTPTSTEPSDIMEEMPKQHPRPQSINEKPGNDVSPKPEPTPTEQYHEKTPLEKTADETPLTGEPKPLDAHPQADKDKGEVIPEHLLLLPFFLLYRKLKDTLFGLFRRKENTPREEVFLTSKAKKPASVKIPSPEPQKDLVDIESKILADFLGGKIPWFGYDRSGGGRYTFYYLVEKANEWGDKVLKEWLLKDIKYPAPVKVQGPHERNGLVSAYETSLTVGLDKQEGAEGALNTALKKYYAAQNDKNREKCRQRLLHVADLILRREVVRNRELPASGIDLKNSSKPNNLKMLVDNAPERLRATGATKGSSPLHTSQHLKDSPPGKQPAVAKPKKPEIQKSSAAANSREEREVVGYSLLLEEKIKKLRAGLIPADSTLAKAIGTLPTAKGVDSRVLSAYIKYLDEKVEEVIRIMGNARKPGKSWGQGERTYDDYKSEARGVAWTVASWPVFSEISKQREETQKHKAA